jgi:hypothetical protein
MILIQIRFWMLDIVDSGDGFEHEMLDFIFKNVPLITTPGIIEDMNTLEVFRKNSIEY